MIEVRLADGPRLRDEAYALRFRVFRQAEYDLGSDTFSMRRFVDFWDTFDTTFSYVAIVDGKVVATLRAVVENELGLPEVPYDFVPYRQRLGTDVRVCFFGRLATDDAYRSRGLGVLLQEVAVSHMRRIGVHYVLGLANTRYTEWWERFGYVWIDRPLACPGAEVELRPHVLDLRELPARLAERDFCGMARVFPDESRWMFFERGELLYSEGAPSEQIWEILVGEIQVSNRGDAGVRYGRNEIVGEVEILAPGPRSSSATVSSESAVCVVVDRTRLAERLAESSPIARQLLRGLSHKARAAEATRAPG